MAVSWNTQCWQQSDDYSTDGAAVAPTIPTPVTASSSKYSNRQPCPQGRSRDGLARHVVGDGTPFAGYWDDGDDNLAADITRRPNFRVFHAAAVSASLCRNKLNVCQIRR